MAEATVTNRRQNVVDNFRKETFKATAFTGGGPSGGFVRCSLNWVDTVKVEERVGEARTMIYYRNAETAVGGDPIPGSVYFDQVDADATILEVEVTGW